ncbi:armadillo-type protein [Syncephalis plumigaleata]|nr:armadillo-type protein [Syncephalis plumigaleata]
MAAVFSGLVKSTLSSLVGGTGGQEFPYTIGERVTELGRNDSVWALYEGRKTSDNSAVSVLVYEKARGSSGELALARNAFSKFRTIRHPGLIRYIDGIETDAYIYLATDTIRPLRAVLNNSERNDNLIAWGLFNIAKMVHFLNNDCNLVHGNIRISSIFVNGAGEWKLGGLELLSSLKDEHPFITSNAGLMPDAKRYATPEVTRGTWETIKEYEPSATDSWHYACLVYELFNGTFTNPEQLRTPGKIPSNLRQPYLTLLDSNPRNRASLGRFMDHTNRPNGYFMSEFVQANLFLENFNVKDQPEREAFLARLTPMIGEFPTEFNRRKLLPELLKALEFGSGGNKVIKPIAQISEQLDEQDYHTLVAPVITRLFALPDRSIRMGLLEHLGPFVQHLSSKVICNTIFPHYVNYGFTDSAPIIRDATVRSALMMAPSDKVNNQELAKYICKALMDPEPGIRTNAIICLGKLSRYMNETTRSKSILVALFNGLRDPFPSARSAALMAITGDTLEDYPIPDYASRILPAISPLLIDSYRDVRVQAFKAIEQMMQKLQVYSEQMPDEPTPDPNANMPSGSNTTPTSSVGGIAISVGAEWAGWAVTSVAKKISDVAFTSVEGSLPTSNNTSHQVSTSSQYSNNSNAPTLAAPVPQPRIAISKAFSNEITGSATTTTTTTSTAAVGWDDFDLDLGPLVLEDDDDKQSNNSRPTSSAAHRQTNGGMKLGGKSTESTNLLADIDDDGWGDDGWGLDNEQELADPFGEHLNMAEPIRRPSPDARTAARSNRTDELNRRREERRQVSLHLLCLSILV